MCIRDSTHTHTQNTRWSYRILIWSSSLSDGDEVLFFLADSRHTLMSRTSIGSDGESIAKGAIEFNVLPWTWIDPRSFKFPPQRPCAHQYLTLSWRYYGVNLHRLMRSLHGPQNNSNKPTLCTHLCGWVCQYIVILCVLYVLKTSMYMYMYMLSVSSNIFSLFSPHMHRHSVSQAEIQESSREYMSNVAHLSEEERSKSLNKIQEMFKKAKVQRAMQISVWDGKLLMRVSFCRACSGKGIIA